jgi:hypothetical protein
MGFGHAVHLRVDLSILSSSLSLSLRKTYRPTGVPTARHYWALTTHSQSWYVSATLFPKSDAPRRPLSGGSRLGFYTARARHARPFLYDRSSPDPSPSLSTISLLFDFTLGCLDSGNLHDAASTYTASCSTYALPCAWREHSRTMSS